MCCLSKLTCPLSRLSQPHPHAPRQAPGAPRLLAPEAEELRVAAEIVGAGIRIMNVSERTQVLTFSTDLWLRDFFTQTRSFLRFP